MFRLFVLILVCGLGIDISYAQPLSAGTEYSEDERSAILSLGPWPPARVNDLSNRVSGNPKAIALGHQLFFDRRLSKDDLLSCADCHHEEKQFSDGIALNKGHGKIDRHTTALMNLRWNNWFGWGGEADSLWAQSIRPILSENEMAASKQMVKDLVAEDPELACKFRDVFGQSAAEADVDTVLVLVGKTLAAFQETLISEKSVFDRYRDGVAADDGATSMRYPEAAKRGLKIFAGKGRCTLCHFGPRFTNGEFADIGVPFFVSAGKIDKGRYGGIQILKRNPFNLLGKYNDDTTGARAVRTQHVQLRHRSWGEFKVPSLRGVAETAPYMHNGSIKTLDDVIDFYSELNEERLHSDGEKILRPLNLTKMEKGDLKAFLETLSAPVVAYQNALEVSEHCAQ